MNNNAWWYAAGSDKNGPISQEELLERVAADQINLDTFVWKQGWKGWCKLSDAQEISSQVQAVLQNKQVNPPPLPSEVQDCVGPMTPPQVVPPQVEEDVSANEMFEYAGFWRRFAAAWLDAMVLIPAYIPYWLISATKGQDHPSTLLGLLVVLVMSAIYFTKMESSESGASYGKRWVGIKVVGVDRSRISTGRAFSRWIAHLLSYLSLYIGFFIQPFTKHKQALHDLVAGTLIVQTEKAKTTSKIVLAIPMAFVTIFLIGVVAAIAIPSWSHSKLEKTVEAQQNIPKFESGWVHAEGMRDGYFVDYSKLEVTPYGHKSLPSLLHSYNQSVLRPDLSARSIQGKIFFDCERRMVATSISGSQLLLCTGVMGEGRCLTDIERTSLENDVAIKMGFDPQPLPTDEDYRNDFKSVESERPKFQVMFAKVCG